MTQKLKFKRTKNVLRVGRDNQPLPDVLPGYQAGPFTIHQPGGPGGKAWVISFRGLYMFDCTFLSTAQAAIRDLHASGWDDTLSVSDAAGAGRQPGHPLRDAALKARDKYQFKSRD